MIGTVPGGGDRIGVNIPGGELHIKPGTKGEAKGYVFGKNGLESSPMSEQARQLDKSHGRGMRYMLAGAAALLGGAAVIFSGGLALPVVGALGAKCLAGAGVCGMVKGAKDTHKAEDERLDRRETAKDLHKTFNEALKVKSDFIQKRESGRSQAAKKAKLHLLALDPKNKSIVDEWHQNYDKETAKQLKEGGYNAAVQDAMDEIVQQETRWGNKLK